METGLEKITKCLHQGEKPLGFMNNGQGNCAICTFDDGNKACPRYYPISVYVFYVSKKIESKDEQK